MQIGFHPAQAGPVWSLVSVLAIMVWHLLTAAIRTEEVRRVAWDDLVPPQAPLADPLGRLAMNDKVELGLIAEMRQPRHLARIEADLLDDTLAAVMVAGLAARGLDVDALLAAERDFKAAIEARGHEIVPDLDGQLVRVPGYALPLEFADKTIHRFLLMPTVGACIHTPPPSPNQLIVVELAAPRSVEDVYEPVWVTGRLRAAPGRQALSFLDSAADVHFGYALEGGTIEPLTA